MDDNWRTAVGYICIALVFITMYLGAAWVMSPSEFTFKIEMDNNTKDAFESINYSEISGGKGDCKFDAEYWYNNGNGITSEDVNKTKLRDQIICFNNEIIEEENIGFALGEKDE